MNIRSYHIRIICLIRIYSDIRSYHFFDTNIFGYIYLYQPAYTIFHRDTNIFGYIYLYQPANTIFHREQAGNCFGQSFSQEYKYSSVPQIVQRLLIENTRSTIPKLDTPPDTPIHQM